MKHRLVLAACALAAAACGGGGASPAAQPTAQNPGLNTPVPSGSGAPVQSVLPSVPNESESAPPAVPPTSSPSTP